MTTSTLMLGELANAFLTDPSIGRIAIVTSPTTGNPALASINLCRAQFAISLQYDHVDDIDELVDRYGATFDLVVVDPLHTYESSVGCIDRCTQLLRPGGVMLCHDCVPPPEFTEPEFTTGCWSGVTFAAFRDVLCARKLRWCTLAADFGIGVAVAAPAIGPESDAAVDPAWTRETHEHVMERYGSDPFTMMRTVRPEVWPEAVHRLCVGQPVDDLLAAFERWEDVLPPRRAERQARAAGQEICFGPVPPSQPKTSIS